MEEGIVINIRRNRNGFSVLVVLESGERRLLEVGRVDEVNVGDFVRFDESGIVEVKERKDFIEAFRKKLEYRFSSIFSPLKDEVMSKLKNNIVKGAAEIYMSYLFNFYTIVRFHGDADGISSAFPFFENLKATYIQQNSFFYSIKDALNDISNATRGYNPLLILLDFGSSKESFDGLELVKQAGFNVVLIDHHPLYNKISEKCIVINPSVYGDYFYYTASYLSYEVSRLLGWNSNYYKIGLAGDKSNLFDISEEDRNKALVLDFLATYNIYGNNISFYHEVLNDKNLYNTFLQKAQEKVDEIKSQIEKVTKIDEVKGIRIAIIDMEKIAKSTEFPSKGKIAGIAFDYFGGKKSVILGVYNAGIIFRISEDLLGIVDALSIINNIKERYSYTIYSGGGHKTAASIRIKQEYKNFILEEILREVRERINNSVLSTQGVRDH